MAVSPHRAPRPVAAVIFSLMLLIAVAGFATIQLTHLGTHRDVVRVVISPRLVPTTLVYSSHVGPGTMTIASGHGPLRTAWSQVEPGP